MKMQEFRDFGNDNFVKCLTAAVRTADANGASVDRKGYDGVLFQWSIGVSGDTLSGSVYSELELEHSDDNSTFTDCADANLSASVTGNNTGTAAKIDDAAEDDVIVTVAYLGTKRYVRPVYNITGTHTNGTPTSCVAIQNRAKYPT
jgi:hypothetical protein